LNQLEGVHGHAMRPEHDKVRAALPSVALTMQQILDLVRPRSIQPQQAKVQMDIPSRLVHGIKADHEEQPILEIRRAFAVAEHLTMVCAVEAQVSVTTRW
jgi:hypothetical protein